MVGIELSISYVCLKKISFLSVRWTKVYEVFAQQVCEQLKEEMDISILFFLSLFAVVSSANLNVIIVSKTDKEGMILK